jgi:hypothetical protein
MFSTEALQRHASSKWDPINREVGTAEEAELAQFLAEDDELNFTDEPTHEKPILTQTMGTQETLISLDIPAHTPENFPSMNAEDNSVSTFHPKLFTEEVDNPDNISISKHRQRKGAQINSVLKEPQNYEDPDTMSKMSDSASRISSIKTDISELTNQFQLAFDDLQLKAKQQADKQVQQD